MEKCLVIIKIKPEMQKEYIEIHKNAWKEMLQAIKESGFINEKIWYFENQSIIYFEVEDYEASNAKLRSTDICKKWDLVVSPWFEQEPVMAEQIFDMWQ